jgi:hypothetical protein
LLSNNIYCNCATNVIPTCIRIAFDILYRYTEERAASRAQAQPWGMAVVDEEAGAAEAAPVAVRQAKAGGGGAGKDVPAGGMEAACDVALDAADDPDDLIDPSYEWWGCTS